MAEKLEIGKIYLRTTHTGYGFLYENQYDVFLYLGADKIKIEDYQSVDSQIQNRLIKEDQLTDEVIDAIATETLQRLRLKSNHHFYQLGVMQLVTSGDTVQLLDFERDYILQMYNYTIEHPLNPMRLITYTLGKQIDKYTEAIEIDYKKFQCVLVTSMLQTNMAQFSKNMNLCDGWSAEDGIKEQITQYIINMYQKYNEFNDYLEHKQLATTMTEKKFYIGETATGLIPIIYAGNHKGKDYYCKLGRATYTDVPNLIIRLTQLERSFLKKGLSGQRKALYSSQVTNVYEAPFTSVLNVSMDLETMIANNPFVE